MDVVLGGKSWPVQEPVFKTLREVIALYNRINDPTQSLQQRADAIIGLMKCLINDPALFPPWWLRLVKFRSIKPITQNEIHDFLQAVPSLCKLETVKTAQSTAKDPWGELYAFFACCNGYTWDQIDNTLTITRSEQIQDYWLHNPPEHIIQKAKIGYEYKPPKTLEEFFNGLSGIGSLH